MLYGRNSAWIMLIHIPLHRGSFLHRSNPHHAILLPDARKGTIFLRFLVSKFFSTIPTLADDVRPQK